MARSEDDVLIQQTEAEIQWSLFADDIFNALFW